MGLLPEVLKDVVCNLRNPHRVQQGMFIFSGSDFLLVCLGFYGLKLRTHIIVIHLKFQDFFITDGIGDDIGMQLITKYTGSIFRAQRIFTGKNRCACETKLIKTFKFLLQVFLGFPELAAMTFIKNKDDLFLVDG
ncbi:Uncharacterised protein [Enterobacter cloacae]|nr:Uncharacterised protein [Enterobacter cloacae]